MKNLFTNKAAATNKEANKKGDVKVMLVSKAVEVVGTVATEMVGTVAGGVKANNDVVTHLPVSAIRGGLPEVQLAPEMVMWMKELAEEEFDGKIGPNYLKSHNVSASRYQDARQEVINNADIILTATDDENFNGLTKMARIEKYASIKLDAAERLTFFDDRSDVKLEFGNLVASAQNREELDVLKIALEMAKQMLASAGAPKVTEENAAAEGINSQLSEEPNEIEEAITEEPDFSNMPKLSDDMALFARELVNEQKIEKPLEELVVLYHSISDNIDAGSRVELSENFADMLYYIADSNQDILIKGCKGITNGLSNIEKTFFSRRIEKLSKGIVESIGEDKYLLLKNTYINIADKMLETINSDLA